MSTDTPVDLGGAVGSMQGSRSSRRLTAFFDSRPAAQTAIDDLVSAGVPADGIRLTEGVGSTAVTEQPSATAANAPGSNPSTAAAANDTSGTAAGAIGGAP